MAEVVHIFIRFICDYTHCTLWHLLYNKCIWGVICENAEILHRNKGVDVWENILAYFI